MITGLVDQCLRPLALPLPFFFGPFPGCSAGIAVAAVVAVVAGLLVGGGGAVLVLVGAVSGVLLWKGGLNTSRTAARAKTPTIAAIQIRFRVRPGWMVDVGAGM